MVAVVRLVAETVAAALEEMEYLTQNRRCQLRSRVRRCQLRSRIRNHPIQSCR